LPQVRRYFGGNFFIATRTPFWTHVNPYGRFELDMNSRLDLGLATPIPGQRTEEPQPPGEAPTMRRGG
jgi:hypothetical protein